MIKGQKPYLISSEHSLVTALHSQKRGSEGWFLALTRLQDSYVPRTGSVLVIPFELMDAVQRTRRGVLAEGGS